MRFKMIFLIFALAMFMLAGVAWTEDDDDQGEDDNARGSVAEIGGSGFYCFVLFTLPDEEFVQTMVNDPEPEGVSDRVVSMIEKYVEDEEGELEVMLCGTTDIACMAEVIDGPIVDIGSCDGAAGLMIDDILAHARPPCEYCKIKLSPILVSSPQP